MPKDSSYRVKVKPSKYADFMQAYTVHTPKYKFYLERGGKPDDPVILLIMGLGAQSLVWSNVFCKRLIDSGFQVIRYDNRDIGKSSKFKHKNSLNKLNQTRLRKLKLVTRFKLGLPLDIYDIEIPYDLYSMAEDAQQLLNALDIETCYVVGMSMGGMIAQILAANYPHRVTKLGLLATSNNRALLPPPSMASLKALTRASPPKKDTDAVLKNSIDLWRTIGSPEYFDEARAMRRAKILYKRRFYPKGVTRQLLAILATGSLTFIDTKIKQPTLIIHGMKDSLLPPAHGRALAKAIPHAELKLVAGLGHDIPYMLARYLADSFISHFKQPLPSEEAVDSEGFDRFGFSIENSAAEDTVN